MNSKSTTRKRNRESNEDDPIDGQRLSKIDFYLNNVSSVEESDKLKINNLDIIESQPLTENKSNIYISQNKIAYLDLIWENEVPRKQFINGLYLNEKHQNRENLEYNMALINNFYESSKSSSLIFAIQNGRGLSDEEFDNDIKTIVKYLKMNNEFNINHHTNNKNDLIINCIKNNSKETLEKEDMDIEVIDHDVGNKRNSEENNNENINLNESHIEEIANKIIHGERPNQIINNKQLEEQFEENKMIKNTLIENESDNAVIESSSQSLVNYQSSVNSNETCGINNGTSSVDSDTSVNMSNSQNSITSTSRNLFPNKLIENKQFHENNDFNENLIFPKNLNRTDSPSNCDMKKMDEANNQIENRSQIKKIDEIIKMKLIDNLKGTYFNEDEPIDTLPSYNFTIKITLVNFRSFTFNVDREVREGEILIKELPIPTYFYNKFLELVDPKIIVEILAKKNYIEESGFRGIVNEAMTCYMNSLLQTLNILGYFKKAVFQIPPDLTPEGKALNSISFSLQRLFYDLMNEKDSVSTNLLINSFGWSRDEIFIQHDIQEFNLLLCDTMENKMKGTKAEGTFKYLFEGKLLNYIECIDVQFKSEKIETYCDLQLTVKGCKDIYESLNKYTEEEILDKEDKYQTEEYGKQKAKKGIKFVSFPPVLMLQLKRFEYNARKDQMDKINDHFEYYDEIDLSKYVHRFESNNQEEENYRYTLHSIVVHKGGINSGHYYAFIKPGVENKWYMFNDEFVREAIYDEVFTYNFGGMPDLHKHKDRGNIIKIRTRPDANAYILVYIKNSLKSSILCPISDQDIPEEVKQMIEKEKREEKRAELLRMRKTKNMNVFLINKNDIFLHKDIGILPSSLDVNPGENLLKLSNTCFNLPKELKIKGFLLFISQCTGIPLQYLILFTFCHTDPNKFTKRHNFAMKNVNSKMIENHTMKDLQILFYSFKHSNKNMTYLLIDVLLPEVVGLGQKIKYNCDINRFSILKLNDSKNIHPNQAHFEENANDKIYNEIENFQEDEFEYQIDSENVIYIPKSNKYILNSDLNFGNKFENNLLMNQNKSNLSNCENSADYKLLIFKFLKIDENSDFSFCVDQILQIKSIENSDRDNKNSLYSLNNLQNFVENMIKKNYVPSINEYLAKNNSRVYFYLEKTCCSYVKKDTQIIVNNDSFRGKSIIHDEHTTAAVENKEVDIIINSPKEVNMSNIEMEQTPEPFTETEVLIKVDNLHELIENNKETDSFVIYVNFTFGEDSLISHIDKLSSELFRTIYIQLSFHTLTDKFAIVSDMLTGQPLKFSFLLDEEEDEIKKRLLKVLKKPYPVLTNFSTFSEPQNYATHLINQSYPSHPTNPSYPTIPNYPTSSIYPTAETNGRHPTNELYPNHPVMSLLRIQTSLLKNILSLFESLETFYMKSDKSVLNIDEFINYLTIDNIYLESQNYSQNLILQEIAKYPLIKFLGASRSAQKRNLEFLILPYNIKENDLDFRLFSLVLFDINNNPMFKIHISLPKIIKKCSEIIDYIYQTVLSRFYKIEPHSNNNFIDISEIQSNNDYKNNFYFIIQHGLGTFAFDILVESSANLLRDDYERNLYLEYRLQIFSKEEIETFVADERIKLFVAFITKEGNSACYPIIIFIKKNSTVLETKNLIIVKMKKINQLQVYGEVSLSKVKFYTYSLENYRPVKDILLINSKDEEQLIFYFKGKKGPYNILIEFLIGAQNNFFNGSCFLQNTSLLNIVQ